MKMQINNMGELVSKTYFLEIIMQIKYSTTVINII